MHMFCSNRLHLKRNFVGDMKKGVIGWVICIQAYVVLLETCAIRDKQNATQKTSTLEINRLTLDQVLDPKLVQ